jgi:hypothetical protein
MTSADEAVLPDKNWRVMGLHEDGREFLLTMGVSAEDGLSRLKESLDEFSREELAAVSSIWLEQWVYDDFFGNYRWEPTVEIPLRRYRLRVAALAQHAGRASA